MTRTLIALSLTVPLALVGCKKKGGDVEPMAEPAPPPAPEVPAIEFSYGDLSFTGEATAGTVGTLNYKVMAKNNTDTGLVITAVDLGILGASGNRTCSVRGDMVEKASAGNGLAFEIGADCLYERIPTEGDIAITGRITYKVGGEVMEEIVDAKAPFAQ